MRGMRLVKEFIESEEDERISDQINNFLLTKNRQLIDVKYYVTPETEHTYGYTQALLIYEEDN
ncbi:sporulation protein Cse60 [Oceanobacillus sojae]|uniref:sporulation protein Cse60 n=1 Tax=Oceanobacillus sojae TaxID=582851 RepID=UPI00098836D2|nr:sporulation protein Cse60 [Oceanobacillus sojae]